jgi:hypothetical protein
MSTIVRVLHVGVIAVLMSGCGGDPGRDLVGTWDDGRGDTVVFNSDGSTSNDGTSGAWTTDGNEIVITTPDGEITTAPFYLNDDELVLSPMIKQGSNNGSIVGTWVLGSTREQIADGVDKVEHDHLSVDCQNDSTVTITVAWEKSYADSGSDMSSGTYRMLADGSYQLTIHSATGEDSTFTLVLIDGAVLSDPQTLFRRQ